VLHRTNVILTVVFHELPWIEQQGRVQVQQVSPLFWRVRVNYGFRDVPDVPQALGSCAAQGLDINLFETSYFLSRETLIAPGNGMAPWRERLFATLSRNAGSVVDFFRIPVHNVIELGTRIQL
jgi:KUP system potassium uptake protein